MALEEYLNALRFGGQQLQQAGSTLQDINKAQRLREIGSQLPETIQNGGGLALAGQMMDLDPATARQLLKDSMPAGPGNTLSFDKLMAMNPGNVPADIVKGIAESGLDSDKQVRALFSSEDAKMGQISENRRLRGEVQAPVKDFVKQFNTFEKETNNLDKSFKGVDSALKQKSLPADAVVFNFLARNVAGEKGPLSDNDRAQFVSRAFAGNEQAAENFFTGRSTSKLTNAQRKAFYDLVASTRDNYNQWRQETATSILGNYALMPELSRGGKAHKALEAKAKRYGLDINLDKETDTLSVKKQKREKMKKPLTGETDVTSLMNKLPPDVQSQVKPIVDEYIQAGAPIPSELVEEIRKAASGQ